MNDDIEGLREEKAAEFEAAERYLAAIEKLTLGRDELQAENESLREELREVRVLISDYWEPEVERLRKEHEYMTVKTAQYDDMVTENERLREEIVEARESRDQHFAGRQHNAREVERLRAELNEATKSTGGWREYVMRQKADAEAEVERLRKLVETVDRQRIQYGDEVERLREELRIAYQEFPGETEEKV